MQTCLHAHLSLKEAALARLKTYERRERNRFQPSDRGLASLPREPHGHSSMRGIKL
jgi:hypothetical protein